MSSRLFRGLPSDIEHRERPGRDPNAPRGPGGWGIATGASRMQIAPPWVDRPPSATDFQLSTTLAAVDLASSPATFPGSFTIPSGNVGVIRSVSILANGLLTSSQITWELLYNGNPVNGWNALTIPPRAAGSVSESWTPEETFIPVDEGSVITARVSVADGGTYQVSISLHGWFYPGGLDRLARAAYGMGA